MSEFIHKEKWELERQVFQLRTLLEVAQTLAECHDDRAILSQVLAILAGTFGVSRALALSRLENGVWSCAACRGEQLDGEVTSQLREAGAAPVERILSKLTPLLDHDAGMEHIASAILKVKDEARGAWLLGPRLLGEPYSVSDRELLEAVASFSAKSLENVLLYEALNEAQQRLRLENISLKQAAKKEYTETAIIGNSAAIQQVLQQVRTFGRSEANLLITGETGTGKELVARAVHYHSMRADGPFLGINCTAIPENLVETEFFGIESGTATGVKKHIGLFEQANAGTLFIDEIGDMPASVQAKLLRVLQERLVRRVGGDRELPVDVRVVAATNKNLAEEIAAGRFREDLYYRIAVLELRVPPLRERIDDIPVLAAHFLSIFEERLRKKTAGFSTELLQAFTSYAWPGNVRELENEVERLVTLAEEGERLLPAHLPAKLTISRGNHTANQPASLRLREAVEQLERQFILEALRQSESNKSQAARLLGLSRLGLQQKMDRLGITRWSTAT